MVTRRKNTDYRTHEFLQLDEVNELMRAAATSGRHQLRDETLLLLMFRHGLRAGEAATLRWDAVDLKQATLYVTRLKRGKSGFHPLQPDELALLNALKQANQGSVYVFVGERGGNLSRAAIGKIVDRVGHLANLPTVHPHMFRHACGYHLANQGTDTRLIQEWLGHVNIQHTARYTAIAPGRFKSFTWD